jgi:hypothetical protein
MALARRRRGRFSSYADQSARMKHDAGKTYYRKTRKTSAGEAKHKKASKRTAVRRRRTSKIAKLFKIIVAKKRRRR